MFSPYKLLAMHMLDRSILLMIPRLENTEMLILCDVIVLK